jgi:hypothetical protein
VHDDVWPSFEYDPTLQREQTKWSASYDPAVHSLHEAWAVSGWTQPSGHVAHLVVLSEYAPASHSLHSIWPALGCTQPLGQILHVLPSSL